MSQVLTGPLLDLPPTVRDQVLVEVDAILASRPDDAALSCLLTGSLAEGLGNTRSDIDVYLLVPDADRPRVQSTAIGLRSERYVDCEYMGVRGLTSVADRVEAHADPSTQLKLVEVDRFYRISIACRYLVDPAMEDLLDRFDKDVACAATATYYAGVAARDASRAAVLRASGRARPGLLRLREAVLADATARLARDGEGYPSTKWVFEKAARSWGTGSVRFSRLTAAYGCGEAGALELEAELLGSAPGPVLLDRPQDRYRLAPQVVHVTGSEGGVLVRGYSAIRDVNRPLTGVLDLLDGGASLSEATEAEANRLALAPEVLRLALADDLSALYAEGFLELDEEETVR